MKTQNAKLYLSILDDYLSGNGIDLDNYHLNKEDIDPMLSFYFRILKPEIYAEITRYIITEIL